MCAHSTLERKGFQKKKKVTQDTKDEGQGQLNAFEMIKEVIQFLLCKSIATQAEQESVIMVQTFKMRKINPTSCCQMCSTKENVLNC